jgi:NifU-like protein involved in Fe-S cluster formation
VTADSDLIKLYSGRILALAADIPHTGRLEAPQASAKRRSPLCGSTVAVDLDLSDGRISRFAQEVRACALGQAAAAVLGAQAIGRDRDEIERGLRELRAMLKEGGPAPAPPFEALEVLMPARDYRNRHASIQLAFEATLEAMDAAARTACA